MEEPFEQPDEWCELCEYRLAVMQSKDGVWACARCAERAIEVLSEPVPATPNRKQRRAAQRETRLRNNGRSYGG
jgi:ribosomal protein L37AE/L43A